MYLPLQPLFVLRYSLVLFPLDAEADTILWPLLRQAPRRGCDRVLTSALSLLRLALE